MVSIMQSVSHNNPMFVVALIIDQRNLDYNSPQYRTTPPRFISSYSQP